jgi:hypothetical protein
MALTADFLALGIQIDLIKLFVEHVTYDRLPVLRLVDGSDLDCPCQHYWVSELSFLLAERTQSENPNPMRPGGLSPCRILF